MAVDEQLNARMRAAIGDRDGVTEKKMMGGVCFLLNGNMVGGEPMVQGGRRMSGLYFVAEDACPQDVMAQWLDLAVSFAETLPRK